MRRELHIQCAAHRAHLAVRIACVLAYNLFNVAHAFLETLCAAGVDQLDQRAESHDAQGWCLVMKRMHEVWHRLNKLAMATN